MVVRHNTFEMQLTTIFSSSVSTCPMHVLHDGHRSHFNSVAVWYAIEGDTILFNLLLHITYEIKQPDNIG